MPPEYLPALGELRIVRPTTAAGCSWEELKKYMLPEILSEIPYLFFFLVHKTFSQQYSSSRVTSFAEKIDELKIDGIWSEFIDGRQFFFLNPQTTGQHSTAFLCNLLA